MHIHTDASFDQVTGIGGYAFHIQYKNKLYTKSGAFKLQLSGPSEAELCCIGNAFAYVLRLYQEGIIDRQEVEHIFIKSDFKYVYQLMFKRRKQEPFKTIWNMYWELGGVTIHHVKAHTDKATPTALINAWCDEQAKSEMWKKVSNEKKKCMK